jgi:hypothetical protein
MSDSESGSLPMGSASSLSEGRGGSSESGSCARSPQLQFRDASEAPVGQGRQAPVAATRPGLEPIIPTELAKLPSSVARLRVGGHRRATPGRHGAARRQLECALPGPAVHRPR